MEPLTSSSTTNSPATALSDQPFAVALAGMAALAAAMGIEMDWNADPEHTAPMPLEVPEGDSRWLDDLQPRADEGTSS